MTSSAVVGSSARSRVGLAASAIAIMIRCRIPPLNWCGYDAGTLRGIADSDAIHQFDRAPMGRCRN